MPDPIYGFHHICLDKNGLDIFIDQLKTLKESGLYDASEAIFCSLLGNSEGIQLPKKYVIVYQDEDSILCERPVLEFMKNNATKYRGKYWYIHTKGISHHGSYREQNVKDWRKYMEYFLIQKWKTCYKDLDTYDIAGVNYEKIPFYHYSGNFWWATSKYISTNETEFTNEDYYETEFWLCRGKPSHIGISYHSSKPLNHYEHRYPPQMYVAKEQLPFVFSPGLSETMFEGGYESSKLNFNSFELLPAKIIRDPKQREYPN